MNAHPADTLNEKYHDASALDIVQVAIRDLFPSRIAAVSSFGAESAVLLHLIAQTDRQTPVLGEYHRQLTACVAAFLRHQPAFVVRVLEAIYVFSNSEFERILF